MKEQAKKMEMQNNERKKIVDAAKQLAMADGFYNLTAVAVADTAEVAEETFYKFFKDISELQAELVLTRYGLNDESVLNLPLKEKLKTFSSAIISQIETGNIKDFRNWVYTNRLEINGHEEVLIFSDKEILKNLLLASIKSGELTADTPVEEITEFIVSLVYGLTVNWSMTDGKFEPLEHIEAFNNLIINALIPYIK